MLQNFVNVSAYARRDVESIYVYIRNDRDRFMTTTDGIVDLAAYSDRDWYLSFLSHPADDASWTETRVLNRLPAVELGRPVVTIYRRLYPLAGVRLPGVVVLNIHRRFFSDLIGQLKGCTRPAHRHPRRGRGGGVQRLPRRRRPLERATGRTRTASAT